MKNFARLLSSLAFVILMTSCEFKEVDLGYPHSVRFSKDGGEKIVTGTICFTDAHIHDYKSGEDGDFLPNQDGLEGEFYKWLKIEYTPNSTELKIIAEPNTSGKSRKLHIELYSGPEYHTIKVEQE